MRCPYCEGLNSERASFCVQCGRDLPSAQSKTRQQSPPSFQHLPQQMPYQPVPRSVPTQPGAVVRPAPPSQTPQTLQPQRPPASVPRPAPPIQAPRVPFVPQPTTQLQQDVEPPPANFPPRTMTQLKELQAEVVPYTLINDAVTDGRKKIIRIIYRRCTAWQQVVTLLKAFNEQSTAKFDIVIVQGIVEHDTTPYPFTNGQLQFDRNVRLGSQTLNRYQIETGNGFEITSVRIVLSE